MIAVDNSSIANTSLTRTVLANNNCPSNRKRCISLIGKQNHVVGKRLKIVPVYTAMLPQKRVQVRNNLPVDSKVLTEGTNIYTDVITSKTNNDAKNRNDEGEDVSSKPTKPNCDSAELESVSWINSARNITSKTRKSTLCVMGPSADVSKTCKTKVNFIGKNYSSNVANNTAQIFSETENCPSGLNASVIDGNLHTDVKCVGDQKVHPIAKKEHSGDTMLSRISTGSHIRDDDCHKLDNRNGRDVASEEGNIADSAVSIELVKSPLKNEKEKTTMRGEKVSGSDVAFEVAESTSYQKVSHNELNSTGSENQNKTSSVVNVKTISTKDLMKFLRRYNLTLKAVPTNNKNVPNTVNIKSAKFRTVTVNTNSCRQSIPKSCKESISPGPVESKRTVNIKSESVSGNVSSSKTLLSNIKPQYNGNTVFRTTPQGTFSDWKIDVARSAKLCRRPPRISLNGDGRRLNTKNAKLSYSACPKTTVKSHRKLCKRTKNAYHAQAVAVKSHNRSEFLYLSDFECPMKLFPLSTAFRDLEARDKAFRETIETSRSCTDIDLTVNSTACRGNCPLSPTMNTLVNKRNCLRNVVEFHDSDPVLASVVGFDNSETDVDDMEDNLSLNRVLLPAVANNRLKNRHRILDITHGKHNSELQNFKYEPSSGCGETQKSRSTAKPQLEKDVIHDSDSSIFYGFPDSDVDDSSYAVPVIDLKSVPTPVSQHHTEKENYEAMKNSCKNSLDSVSKIRTKGNRAIKIDNHDLNTSNDASYQLHSSNSDIRCSKIKNYNSISTSSSHCSAEACVTPNDAITSSSLESAQTKTGSDIKMKAVNSLFDNHLTKPIEKWTSDEVSSWLTNTIQKYQSESQTSCQGASSKNIKIDESKNLSGNIFSKIKTGRTLRDLDLDKLTAFCEGDSLLVEYLHKKVNQLVESSEKNKIDSATKYKAESDMHQQYRGQCVVANSSYVSAPSVEQLEELVNYEDLLGSDSILGSLELTDVLESHGSFLKSLGQENENRFHQQFNGYNSSQFSQIYNHFSPAGGIPSYDTGHLHGNKFHQYPDVYHNAPSELQSGDFAQHNVSLLNEFSSMSERNTEEINFSNTHFNGPLSPPSVSTATEYCPPISPSTFYNVPPPPLIAMHDCVSEVPSGGAHEINAVTSHAGEMLSPNFICSRDSTMSDTDSGIHSPDSTPNKYTLVGNVPAIADFTCDNGVDPNLQTPSINELNNFSLPIRSSNWQGHARNVLLNSQSIGTLEYNHNKIFTMTGDGSVRQEKSVDSNEESWERSSTSSTTSTLTAGESETKLLNMDDCKMYLTNSSSQSRQSFDCSLNGNSSMLTVHTADGNVVFIPSSQNMTTTPSPTQSIVHSHTSKNSHQFVTQGNITTVYPSFLPQSRRTSCSSQTGGSAGISNKTQGYDRELIDTSVNSKIAMNQNSNSICGVQNRLIGSFDSNNNKRRFQDNMVRRHTCDGPDGSFMDSFDLKIRRTTGKSIHLWEFIRDTLLNHSYCPRLIKWEDRKSGIFRFVQSDVVAGMWGEKKNNPKMTYEKLSRAMRYYYNRGILERVDGRRLVYKFGPNAHGWQQAAGCDETEEPCHETQEESNIKIENVPENNSLQSQKPNSLSSLRRPATCKISVAMSDKILPSPKKRRRLSNDAPQQNPCTTDAAEKAKSMEKQTPAGLNDQIVKVKEECEKLMEVNPEPFKSASTPPAEHTSCIVYVARQVKQPAQDEKQNEDELPSVTSSKASTWLTNTPDNNTSPSKSSKLPSAEVLLGKHYKIATVQCK